MLAALALGAGGIAVAAMLDSKDRKPTSADTDDDSVDAHRRRQDRSGASKASQVAAYRERFERAPTPENGYLLARLLPAAESEALVGRLLAAHPENPWLLRLGARHHLRARRWSDAARAYEALVRASPMDALDSFPLRATALVGAGRMEEALRLAEELPLVPRLSVALAYARLAKIAGGRDPNGYVERSSREEPLPPGFMARYAVLVGGSADLEIGEILDEKERAARQVERDALRDPRAALERLSQAPEGTAGQLDLDVAVVLLGAAERAGLAAVRDELVEALEEHGPLFIDFIRTGRENEGTDDLPPAGLAAIHVARSINLDGSARDELLALAREEDPLRGVGVIAAERWAGATALRR